MRLVSVHKTSARRVYVADLFETGFRGIGIRMRVLWLLTRVLAMGLMLLFKSVKGLRVESIGSGFRV